MSITPTCGFTWECPKLLPVVLPENAPNSYMWFHLRMPQTHLWFCLRVPQTHLWFWWECPKLTCGFVWECPKLTCGFVWECPKLTCGFVWGWPKLTCGFVWECPKLTCDFAWECPYVGVSGDPVGQLLGSGGRAVDADWCDHQAEGVGDARLVAGALHAHATQLSTGLSSHDGILLGQVVVYHVPCL